MIQRSARTGNFTILGNGIFTDNALSFEAMGLLAYLLSKPDNWSIHPRALSKATEGSDQRRGMGKIYDLLNVLIAAGYVVRFKRANGEVDYIVYDEPVRDDMASNPNQENPNQENPNQENPNQDFPDVLINTEGQQELKLNKDGRGANARVRATPPAEPPPPADPPPPAKPPRFEPLAALLALGVDAQVAADWLAVRKAKRAALTQTALDDVVSEAGKAGISVAQAVRICAARGWQGFRASWDWRDDRPQGRTFDHGQPALSAGEQARQQALRIAEKMGLTPEQVGIHDANQ